MSYIVGGNQNKQNKNRQSLTRPQLRITENTTDFYVDGTQLRKSSTLLLPQITTTDFLQALKLRFLDRRRNFQIKNVSTYPINSNYITCVY